MNSYDFEALKTEVRRLKVRVTDLENFQFTSEDGARLADQVRELREDIVALDLGETEDTELTPVEEVALMALEETDYEDDSPEAVAFVHGFLAASE